MAYQKRCLACGGSIEVPAADNPRLHADVRDCAKAVEWTPRHESASALNMMRCITVVAGYDEEWGWEGR